MLDDDECQVGAEHRDIAVGEIDDPHHPEHDREPAREHGVESAQEDPLHDRVGERHRFSPAAGERSPK